jgi:hypothetical protein
MRRYPRPLGFVDINWGAIGDQATDIGRQVGSELANQGLVEGQVALISSRKPNFPLNAEYLYCKADPADPSNLTCDAKSIWFPRISQYAYPHVTPVKELNTLLAAFNITQRVTQPNESVLADLRRHTFYKAAESIAGRATSVSEPQAREIARLAFSKVESARSAKIGDKTYTRGDVLGTPKQVPNDVEISGLDAAGTARMVEKMTAIEDDILAAPGFKDGLLSVDVAKHLVATVGPKHVIPQIRVYLTPDHSEYVEYKAADNKVRVVTKGGDKTFSVEESILPADKLPKSSGGGGTTASGTERALAESSKESWYKTWWGITGIAVVASGGAFLVYKQVKKPKSPSAL